MVIQRPFPRTVEISDPPRSLKRGIESWRGRLAILAKLSHVGIPDLQAMAAGQVFPTRMIRRVVDALGLKEKT